MCIRDRRNVTRTVMNSERHAVSNVMELVLRDAEARWGALLADKISTVRSGRRQLMQSGTVAVSYTHLDVYKRQRSSQGLRRRIAVPSVTVGKPTVTWLPLASGMAA